MKRPRVALFDAALGSAIPPLAAAVPPPWYWAVVALSPGEWTSSEGTLIIPRTKSQSCPCAHEGCIRDAVVAWLPERAIVVAVLIRPALQCLAYCSDVVVAPTTLAAWCRAESIPIRTVARTEYLLPLFTKLVSSDTVGSRHRAQLYRNYLAEVE
ncbi:MAG: hypothetical protein KatS3mg039_0148 [Candidatus Kapaibacterium sp.]|nr:MAG: hypothetical protein KatS3mg039_0148 [Candidatus Kapabacteria bacterium]